MKKTSGHVCEMFLEAISKWVSEESEGKDLPWVSGGMGHKTEKGARPPISLALSQLWFLWPSPENIKV